MGDEALGLPAVPDPVPPPEPGTDLGRCVWHPMVPARASCAGCGVSLCGGCGAPIHVGDGGTGVACPTCAPVTGAAPSVAFEQPGGRGWLAYWRTFGAALRLPTTLFQAFPYAPAGRATWFAWLTLAPYFAVPSCCAGGGLAIFAVVEGGPDGTLARDPDVPFGLIAGLVVGAPWLIWGIAPLLLATTATLYHLIARGCGARVPWTATYRAVCYLTPIQLTALPAIVALYVVTCGYGGQLLGMVAEAAWMAAAMHAYARRVCGLSTGRALLVALGPIAMSVACACGLGAAAVAAVFALR